MEVLELKKLLIRYHPDNPDTGDIVLFRKYHKLYKKFDKLNDLLPIERSLLSIVETLPGTRELEIARKFDLSIQYFHKHTNKLVRRGLVHLRREYYKNPRHGPNVSTFVYPGPSMKYLKEAA